MNILKANKKSIKFMGRWVVGRSALSNFDNYTTAFNNITGASITNNQRYNYVYKNNKFLY